MNCLDSSYLVDFLDSDRARHGAARRWMETHGNEPMYTATFALWEVLRGAAGLEGADAVEDLRAELGWLTSLPFSAEAAAEAATIEAELRADGAEINTADYPIAGTARNAGATLVTTDPDFERVRGLDVVRYDAGD